MKLLISILIIVKTFCYASGDCLETDKAVLLKAERKNFELVDDYILSKKVKKMNFELYSSNFNNIKLYNQLYQISAEMMGVKIDGILLDVKNSLKNTKESEAQSDFKKMVISSTISEEEEDCYSFFRKYLSFTVANRSLDKKYRSFKKYGDSCVLKTQFFVYEYDSNNSGKKSLRTYIRED